MTEPPRIAGVVLAAGRSERMGPANKLLAEIGGEAIVRRAARAVVEAGVAPVVVVTGYEAERVEAALAGLPVRFARNPRYREGLASSLGVGLAAAREEAPALAGVVIALGDMPWVKAAHIEALIARFGAGVGCSICVPVFRGRWGNPVLWAARFVPRMEALEGDEGARALLREHPTEVCEVEVADAGVLRDVDTAAELEEARGG